MLMLMLMLVTAANSDSVVRYCCVGLTPRLLELMYDLRFNVVQARRPSAIHRDLEHFRDARIIDDYLPAEVYTLVGIFNEVASKILIRSCMAD